MPHDNLPRALADYKATVAALLDAYPSETIESLADTIEGCTNLTEALAVSIRALRGRETLADAIGAQIDNMQARKSRLVEGAKQMRHAVLHAMQEAGMTRLPPMALPEATVTLQQGRPGIVVIDEALIPDKYVTVSRKPRLRELGEALKAGERVDGVEVRNGADHLRISAT